MTNTFLIKKEKSKTKYILLFPSLYQFSTVTLKCRRHGIYQYLTVFALEKTNSPFWHRLTGDLKSTL